MPISRHEPPHLYINPGMTYYAPLSGKKYTNVGVVIVKALLDDKGDIIDDHPALLEEPVS
jgi:hypothetical protein